MTFCWRHHHHHHQQQQQQQQQDHAQHRAAQNSNTVGRAARARSPQGALFAGRLPRTTLSTGLPSSSATRNGKARPTQRGVRRMTACTSGDAHI